MKSMTKLMVVAMLLVAALVVAPAAARIDAKTLESGDTIYVGEENLNFASNFNGTAGSGVGITKLVHFSDNTADKTILVSPGFEISKTDVGTTTGPYYAFGTGTLDKGKEIGYVNIELPSVTLDVMLNSSQKVTKDSVNSKSVTKDTVVDFKVQNNLNGFWNTTVTGAVSGAPSMNIEVTLPGGGVTTFFGTVDLKGVTPIGGTSYKPGVNLSQVEAGTYTAVAKWPSGTDFYGKGSDSNSVTFEVLTKALALSANKDTVVRGNSFSVTINGESQGDYYLFVKNASIDANKKYPLIATGQNGVVNSTAVNFTENEAVKFAKVDAKTVPRVDNAQAWVTTNAGGTRTIQFNTEALTDDRQFTIRIQSLKDPSTYDEVKVRVEKGDVTITTSGTGVYYIGEEITLSGTNTDSKTVYLFLTGPNLGSDGVRLDEGMTPVVNNQKGNFTKKDVEADDTWSFKWNTAQLGRVLDAGGYTIYAATQPQGKNNLTDVKYATASVQLKSGFISATSSGATVAKGDDLKLTGTAQGNPDNVNVWVFGKNYYGKNNRLSDSATVESDGSFEYKLEDTKDLSAGQYFAVIQHPMSENFGIRASGDSIYGGSLPAAGIKLTNLQASDAATALIDALDSPYVDDTYVKLTFVIEEPNIFIDPIGTKAAGSKFTITGSFRSQRSTQHAGRRMPVRFGSGAS